MNNFRKSGIFHSNLKLSDMVIKKKILKIYIEIARKFYNLKKKKYVFEI